MDRETAKQEIRSRYAEYLQPAKKRGTYICPLCGNGTGADGDGLTVNPHSDGLHLKCFRCGFSGDLINLYQQEHGCSTAEAFAGLYKYFGLHIDGKDEPQRPRPPKAAPARPAEPPVENHTEQYKVWHDALLQAPDALEYLAKRGFNRETIDRFNLGFCREWAHPLHPEYRSSRIIIPRSAGTYTARDMNPNAKYKYQVVGQQRDLFNVAVLEDAENELPYIVVEGELDCAAIVQSGYKYAVGLGSTANRREFIETAKKLAPAAVFILALDNDADDPDPRKSRAGQRAQAEFVKMMEAAGLEYIDADAGTLYGAQKDAAAACVADKAGFWARLQPLVDQGFTQRQNREQQERIDRYLQSGPGLVDLFLHAVRTEKYKPIPTGIEPIDRAIGGGLYRQTIFMLGAAPGMGKTALVSQICESIAKAGTADVLYLNLEMSREQLLARSLARIAYLNGNKSITAAEILQGYSWTLETEEAVLDAGDTYKETIAQHLIYNPGEDTTDLAEIMRKIYDEQKRLGHAPIVVVDYVQLLTSTAHDGRQEEPVVTLKRALAELKQYAIQQDTVCILITANNRASMATGDSDLTSGRDTSNLEYSADIHTGLVYSAVNEGTATIAQVRQAKRAYWKDPTDPAAAADFETLCSRLTLKVNKNRHGAEGREAVLHFNGAAALFIPEDDRHDVPAPMNRI